MSSCTLSFYLLIFCIIFPILFAKVKQHEKGIKPKTIRKRVKVSFLSPFRQKMSLFGTESSLQSTCSTNKTKSSQPFLQSDIVPASGKSFLGKKQKFLRSETKVSCRRNFCFTSKKKLKLFEPTLFLSILT